MKFLALALLSVMNLSFAKDVDIKASEFKWKGTKVSGEHFGKIFLKSGSVTEGKGGNLEAGEFVVDINSLTVEDLEGEWKDKLTGHLKSPDFFDTAKFPTANLKITKVEGTKATGDLTIKGKTSSVTFDFKKDAKAYAGKLVFDRTKFDMIYNSGNFFKDLGDKMIHNDVHLDFKIVTK
jgi:polyisoprenoid-binding protein YceI